MQSFQSIIQSFLTILVVISEYTLLFDRWIIFARAGPVFERQKLPKAQIQRKRWILALRTTIAYALLEPVCCWLMTALPGGVIWWCLFSSAMHSGAISGSITVKIEALQKVQKEHNDLCRVAHAQAESMQTTRAEANEDGEEEHEKLLDKERDDAEKMSSLERDAERKPTTPIPCVMTHQLDRSYQIATYPPIFTAAMMNTGLILYCRYLTLPDSAVWLGGFSFGWTVVALLVLLLFGFAKYNNSRMHDATSRPHVPALTIWDGAQVFTCWALVMLVRAGLRFCLAQTPFTPSAWSATHSALIVEGNPMPANVLTDEDGTVKPTDPRWQWVVLVFNIIVITGNIVYWGHRYYRYRVQRRGARQ